MCALRTRARIRHRPRARPRARNWRLSTPHLSKICDGFGLCVLWVVMAGCAELESFFWWAKGVAENVPRRIRVLADASVVAHPSHSAALAFDAA